MAQTIYLAGPDVFLANALDIAERKRKICREFGFEGLFPSDQETSIGTDARKIFESNCALMRRADIGVFNLTPFRGPSADCGAVFELGFMFSLAKPVHGYSGDNICYSRRVAILEGPVTIRDGHSWDRNGYEIEDFALTDNLMLDKAIVEADGTLTAIKETASEPLAALSAFRSCIQNLPRDVVK
jgi:nucleoside 2-deoxyribosyltransferase